MQSYIGCVAPRNDNYDNYDLESKVLQLIGWKSLFELRVCNIMSNVVTSRHVFDDTDINKCSKCLR